MTREKPSAAPILLLFFLVGVPLLNPSSLVAGEVSRPFLWQSDHGESLAGLHVVSVWERGMVSRTVAETPAGPVILTGVLDALEGSTETRFLHPESGWWAELKTVDDLHATSLDHYFQLATKEHTLKSQPEIELELRTSTGGEFSQSLVLREPPEFYRDFSRVLEERSAKREGLREIPPDAARAILFLHRWLSPESIAPQNKNFAHSLRPVLEVLAPLVEDLVPRASREGVADEAPETWELTAGPLSVGLLSPDPNTRAEQLELLSKFEGVENTDPLSDLRDHPILSPAEEPR